MMKIQNMSWVLPAAALIAANATAEPHVHNKGRLALAPDPNGVQLELVVAAADVWGFEHEPRTEEEKAQRTTALQALEDALPEILQFPSKLGCVQDASNVIAKSLEGQKTRRADRHADEKHGHGHEKHGHEKHGHEGHGHGKGSEDSGGHLEVRATASWSCRRSPLGHDVEVLRPPEIPGLSELEIWVLGAAGQSSTVLHRSSATVRLK